MFTARAFWITRRSGGLLAGSVPPAFTAMVMSLLTRVNCFAMRFQRANMACFLTSKMRPMAGELCRKLREPALSLKSPPMLSYQHDYHAGNHADVLKHAVLTLVIAALQKKPAPLRIFDVHAGSGRYDLRSREARMHAEHETGIARVLAAPPPGKPRCISRSGSRSQPRCAA